MQYIEHCIDQEVWDKLPQGAKDVLRNHHYGPPIKIKGSRTITSSAIVEICVDKDKHTDDADTSILYIEP